MLDPICSPRRRPAPPAGRWPRSTRSPSWSRIPSLEATSVTQRRLICSGACSGAAVHIHGLGREHHPDGREGLLRRRRGQIRRRAEQEHKGGVVRQNAGMGRVRQEPDGVPGHVLSQWPGLPVGVKFDPTDLELLEHLEGKVGRTATHVLVDGFIPTIEEAKGICHTHPENLPGVKLDGIASHFFHKISSAYDVGKRKCRKISHSDHIVCDENLRWHKTGKSRSILDNNGVIKGWKKIVVLYIGFRKGGGKVEKTNSRMHQYHLGVDQDEKQEELVVSKVFYHFSSNDVGQPLICSCNKEYDSFAGENDPTTPITYPAQTRGPNGSPSITEQNQDSFSEHLVNSTDLWMNYRNPSKQSLAILDPTVAIPSQL